MSRKLWMFKRQMTANSIQPIIFLSHGAGPSFYMDAEQAPMFKGLDKNSKAARVLKSFVSDNHIKPPRALVVLSAHWQEETCCINTNDKHSLLYDYGGFPPETYTLEWPVTGDLDVARRVKELLEAGGIECKEEKKRGLDHGVFVPLKLVFPAADIPVIQVSLLNSLDMSEHLKIGEALSDLCKENVLVIGSGFATHGGLSPEGLMWAEPFKEWIHNVLSNSKYSASERKTKFLEYKKVKTFSKAHPTSEHFIPIAICCAASGYQAAEILFSEFSVGCLLNDQYRFPAAK
ncbi:4,5-DOPA dioxygenase extradiol-like [Pecten maximus]|uniref:4,5-DOPA dioxygenase extradiol-like n=1 Tax=Pecten maximus TaxID=6579 RepID=UPI001458320D|nr:4,5-DOPA dioxygenase extradiol-like [Pecten maximus]XP_033745043.1 4,5-DOPA dioxygenase extradiol-like [Pecten maximus]